MLAIGHGGGGDLLVDGGSAGIERSEKVDIISDIEVALPCSE